MNHAAVISGVEAAVYVIPTDAPEADGTLAWDETTLVLVTAQAGGEAGIGWTYAAGAAAAVVTDMLAGVVTGPQRVRRRPAPAEAMARAVRNIGRPGVAATAISAVDVALWDLKARLLGLSVADLLGRVRASTSRSTAAAASPATTSSRPATSCPAGWRPGIDPGEDQDRRVLGRQRAARPGPGRAGPRASSARTRSCTWTPTAATAPARRCGWAGDWPDHGVTWFEEPVSSQDLAGLAAVRSQVTADVAAGEYSWSLADSARLIDAGAVDCLQLDVTRCGGITEFLRGAALAAAHNLQVSAHCCPSLHAHVGAAVPNLRHVEYFHDHQRIEQMLFDGAPDPAGGELTADPAAPGLGLRLARSGRRAVPACDDAPGCARSPV